MQRKVLLFATLSAAITVAMGAMGAHFLKQKISVENLQIFETAIKYQMYHSFALVLIALLIDKFPARYFVFIAYSFILGIVLFSGSLYLLALKPLLGIDNWVFLGLLTPIGGIAFITAWILFFIAILKNKA